MKKSLFLVAAVLSFTACSNESIDAGVPEVSKVTKQGTRIAFQFSLPGDPVTYAGGTRIHTDDERKIHRLDIYQFDGKEESSQLEKIYSNVNYDREGSSDRHTAYILVEATTDKRFVLVTNNASDKPGHISGIVSPAVKGASAGMTFSAFKAQTTKALTSTTTLNGNPLVMSNYKDVNISAGETTVTAELVRVMARIDISNEDENFVLKEVQLKNAKSQAYLLPKDAKEGEAPTSASNLSTPSERVTFQSVQLPQEGSPVSGIGFVNAANGVKKYEHVFYPYPSNTGTTLEEGPVIVLKGTLSYDKPAKTAEVTYEYKLKKDPSTYFGFKRNNIYTLVIKKAISKTELDASIQVNKWKGIVEVDASHVKVIPPQLVGQQTNSAVFTADLDKNKVVVKKGGGLVKLYVNANCSWYERQNPDSKAWITGLSRIVSPNEAGENPPFPNVITFYVEPFSGTGSRNAELELVLNANTSIRTKIEVKQLGD